MRSHRFGSSFARQLSLSVLGAALVCAPGIASAQDGPAGAKTPAELIRIIEDLNRGDTAENKRREQAWRNNLGAARRDLAEVQQQIAAAEATSARLESVYRENEQALVDLNERLRERQGDLGELFGIVRQVAGDLRGVLESSVTSGQPDLAGRVAQLAAIAEARELPKIEELQFLQQEMLREVTETGRITRFTAPVVGVDGQSRDVEVVRVGVFNAISDGKFLAWEWDPSANRLLLKDLVRQPAGRYTSEAGDLQEARPDELVTMSLDPARGAILKNVIATPSLFSIEQIQKGGFVGGVIICIGAIGLLLLVWRFVALFSIGNAMRAQAKSPTANPANPLGRVMAVYEQNRDTDVETLELKLDEAIMKVTPPIETGISTLKVFSVIAPLLGLLGTVTGMIATFTQITLYGTGDPKLMAGGISEALVTTMLGLIMAIPLVLAHSFLRDRSKGLIQILEEQAAGMIAERAEQEARSGRAG
jgi:biopolymer transport protein ExbB